MIYKLSLSLTFTVILNLNCKMGADAQTLTDVLKFTNNTNLTTGFSSNYASYSVDFKAFVGLIKSDTVIGFCITTKCAENYDFAGFNPTFTADKLTINFEDGTYSILKPFQIEKSTEKSGKTTYYLKQYYFETDDFKKFDRPIKFIKISDEKNNVIDEIYRVTPEEVHIAYLLRAYLIPIKLSALNVLPETYCSDVFEGMNLDFAFAKVFTRTKNAFCGPYRSANCKCD